VLNSQKRRFPARAVAGIAWTAPHPLNIPQLHADNVTAGTHISPGNGIELQHGPYAGRLLNVLILESSNVLDVVIYSDDTGQTWMMSQTPLPHNGEAQLAEVRTADGGSSILFNGRSRLPVNGNKMAYPRGIAWSYDGGETFADIRFATDLSAGTSCLASVLSAAQHPVGIGASEFGPDVANTSLLFSHPTHGHRSQGVLLRSDDNAETWQLLGSATPEDPRAMFAYSNLNSLPSQNSPDPSEKYAKLAQKLGQQLLQPFIAVFPQKRMGQLAYFGPT
jgi:hypothetical protein